jgi:dihydrofolate reductase
MVSIIVAVAANGVIGRDGDLPWHLPSDLRHFKRTTMGHFLIVGRKTWEEVGKPLPGRTMVVVTRDRGLRIDDVIVVHSLEEALEAARGDDEVFVAGGGEIYRQALPLADRVYMTRIHADFEGDTIFPELDGDQFRLVERSDHEPDDRDPFPYSFLVYERVLPATVPESGG